MPACNRGYDNHFIVLSHWNITPQAQSCDIPPDHIILATGQPVILSIEWLIWRRRRIGGGRRRKRNAHNRPDLFVAYIQDCAMLLYTCSLIYGGWHRTSRTTGDCINLLLYTCIYCILLYINIRYITANWYSHLVHDRQCDTTHDRATVRQNLIRPLPLTLCIRLHLMYHKYNACIMRGVTRERCMLWRCYGFNIFVWW